MDSTHTCSPNRRSASLMQNALSFGSATETSTLGDSAIRSRAAAGSPGALECSEQVCLDTLDQRGVEPFGAHPSLASGGRRISSPDSHSRPHPAGKVQGRGRAGRLENRSFAGSSAESRASPTHLASSEREPMRCVYAGSCAADAEQVHAGPGNEPGAESRPRWPRTGHSASRR